MNLTPRTADETTSTPAATDAVASIASRIEAGQLEARAEVLATGVPTAHVPAPVEVPAPVGVLAPVEPQARTRRELRERERRAEAASRVVASAGWRRSGSGSISAPRAASAVPISSNAFTVSTVVVSATSTRPAKRPGVKRRILSKLVTVSAMAGVALILVSTTVPANAFVRPDAADSSVTAIGFSEGKPQELKVDATAVPAVARDGYTVVPLARQMLASFGNRVLAFSNDPAGTIQWPFISGVPIATGFGTRHVAGCSFCSTNHQGVDFTPGMGAPIQSIADGVVSLVEASKSGLGNHVVVDHVINGQKVQSVYGHMQYGSIKVAQGQAITVGQPIGLVGSTGASTGAHLHLEIHLNGTPVDPFAWLQANAN